MALQPPDDSLERGGRSLASWLPDLVADEAPTRLAAGEALQAMTYAVPSVHTDLAEIDWGDPPDLEGQSQRFRDAVRAAVEEPGFPRADFVRRLCLYRIALHEDWLRRVDQFTVSDERIGEFQERLIRQMLTSQDDAEREQVTRRFGRLFCASLARDNRLSAEAESMQAPGLMSHIVFDALDTALLADRPGLWAMLRNESRFHEAASALARIGPPAAKFAGFLLERLDDQKEPYRFDGAEALGSIARDDPVLIDALLHRLREGSDPVRIGAASTLFHAGTALAGREEEALTLLRTETDHPERYAAAVPAYASIGRDRPEVLARVLELAAPRPPRWRSYDDGSPDYQYDAVMFERGVAIDSLRFFPRFANRVVPVLVEALDSFEEYDPDEGYGGELVRVCRALEALGPAAAPAIPRLIRYLDEWPSRPEGERGWPEDVFALLTAIGPAAAPALLALERFRETTRDDEESTVLDPIEPLDRAILAIRGG